MGFLGKSKFKDLAQGQQEQPQQLPQQLPQVPPLPNPEQSDPYKEILEEVLRGMTAWVEHGLNKLKTLE